jgi:hypothetical protein
VGEQRERLEKALCECAELGVPDSTDPWPAIRERVSAEHMSGTHVSEEGAADSPRRPWLPRLVPNTSLGWALAVLSVLILDTGAYAASGTFRELFGYGLLGPGSPGRGEATNPEQSDGLAGGKGVADRLLRHYLPGSEGAGLGEEIDQTKTADVIAVRFHPA